MEIKMYYEYFESYLKGFFSLYNLKNKEKYFYPLGLMYSNFMELWIKFCVLNYGGNVEGFTIKSLRIDKHNFYQLLGDEQTKLEFLDMGIPQEEYEKILKEITEIQEILGVKDKEELTYVFRYPTDKNNKLYSLDLSKRKIR